MGVGVWRLRNCDLSNDNNHFDSFCRTGTFYEIKVRNWQLNKNAMLYYFRKKNIHISVFSFS